MITTLRSVRITVGLTLIATAPSFADETADMQSRALAKSFGARLQTALQEALSDAGPAEAVGVCSQVAPQIASKLSRQSGAKVRRTSLRYRNPANAPEPWEADILRRFEAQAATSDPNEPLEYFAIQEDGSVRYMLAIRTGAVCLACHGTALTPSLERKLEQDYPHDRARGYALNDLRGAFSVSWPVPEKIR